MKRVVLLLAMLPATAVLAACGGGEVVIQAQLEGESEAQSEAQDEPRPLEDLEVFILPYDRDVIFDSLAAAYSEPEPEIPDSVLELRDRLAEAQTESRRLENRWSELRQRLQSIRDSLDLLDRSEARYTVLFRDFSELEPQEQQARQASEAAFEEFTDLQRSFANNTQRIRALRGQWENDAFEPVDSIIAARLEESGQEEYADTTDATGVVRVSVPEGEWWVHARYELPFSELYWNIPITVTSGEPVEVVLRRENAEERPLF